MLSALFIAYFILQILLTIIFIGYCLWDYLTYKPYSLTNRNPVLQLL